MTKAKSARVIVTNHDYLLATFANVDNSFLCNTERNLFVFDEAHHLPDKILSAFARSLDLSVNHRDELRVSSSFWDRDHPRRSRLPPSA
jgi:Rad3-related DNA helicase